MGQLLRVYHAHVWDRSMGCFVVCYRYFCRPLEEKQILYNIIRKCLNISGPRIYNKLLSDINDLVLEQFPTRLRSLLAEKVYYSPDEFLN